MKRLRFDDLVPRNLARAPLAVAGAVLMLIATLILLGDASGNRWIGVAVPALFGLLYIAIAIRTGTPRR